jgi:hypothetical protein
VEESTHFKAKRKKKNKTATTAKTLKELTELYRVSLGTSARKEGEVVVVGTDRGGEGKQPEKPR